MERKYSISGNKKVIEMMRTYLAMNKKLTRGYEGATPDIIITELANGAKLIRNLRTDYMELVNPDKDTIKTLAKIIRRTI